MGWGGGREREGKGGTEGGTEGERDSVFSGLHLVLVSARQSGPVPRARAHPSPSESIRVGVVPHTCTGRPSTATTSSPTCTTVLYDERGRRVSSFARSLARLCVCVCVYVCARARVFVCAKRAHVLCR